MKQFDICPIAAPTGTTRHVVVLQHHDIEALSGVIVAPLYPADQLPAVDRLRLPLTFKRRSYLVAIDRLASVPKRQLGPAVGTLEPLRYDIKNALDLVFAGF